MIPFIIMALFSIWTAASPAGGPATEAPSAPEVIELFKERAADGRLKELLARHSTLNVECRTLGGHVFWKSHSSGGYRLQINRVFGNWRILGKGNARLAGGFSTRGLRMLLDDRPTSVVANYLDPGNAFSVIRPVAPTGKSAFLLHGWGVRAKSMEALAERLAAEGYTVYNYDYPTSGDGIEDLARIFLERYRERLSLLPKDERVFFLTHSMGGIMLRTAMAEMDEAECRRIDSIVMLAPPNHGSALAYLGKLPFAGSVNASLGDLAPLSSSHVRNIAPPPFLPPTGIIAGSHDGKVALESTPLPEPLPFSRIVVSSDHPGLRSPRKVMKHVLNFFHTHSFE